MGHCSAPGSGLVHLLLDEAEAFQFELLHLDFVHQSLSQKSRFLKARLRQHRSTSAVSVFCSVLSPLQPSFRVVLANLCPFSANSSTCETTLLLCLTLRLSFSGSAQAAANCFCSA